MNSENKTINYYNQHAEEYYKQTVNIDLSYIYQQFLPHLNFPAHILDAGCGSGRDSLFFLEHGYEVTAVDAAENLAQLAADLIGQPVLNMKLQNLDFNSEFDGIWASASLLHLSDSKVKQVLNKFAQALVPGGVIYISLKYGTQEEIKNGRFFNYYTEETWLALVAEIEELEVIKLWQTEDLKNNKRKQLWLNVLLKRGGNNGM